MRSAWWIVLAGCVVNNGPVGPRPTGGGEPASSGGAAPSEAQSAPTNAGAAPGTMGGAPGVGSKGGCFAGYWRGALDRGGAKYNIRLDLRQSGNQLGGKLELKGYEGIVGTAKMTGTADCN